MNEASLCCLDDLLVVDILKSSLCLAREITTLAERLELLFFSILLWIQHVATVIRRHAAEIARMGTSNHTYQLGQNHICAMAKERLNMKNGSWLRLAAFVVNQ